ncbi:hypothetical protein [Shimia sp.]|uniref:hypothetical protein n=1 Tax=Shimia sp. TaxID=1954381 RepID=UPI003299F5E3
MLIRLFSALLFLFTTATTTIAQGMLLSRMQCQSSYRNIPFTGVIEIQLFQYAGATGLGSAGERSQMNTMIKTGRAHEIPGTLYMIGEFQGGGALVHIEAPNMTGGQGTGSIVINGAAHRATYANFAIVQGGVIALTENQERIDYVCP